MKPLFTRSQSAARRRLEVVAPTALLLTLGLALAGCPPPASRHSELEPRHGRTVRVGIAVRVATVELETRGNWQLAAGGSRMQLPAGTALRGVVRTDHIVVTLDDGREMSDARQVELSPENQAATLRVGNVWYGSKFGLHFDAGALTLIETLDIESYLSGVVPWEIGRLGADALAAVEAQAVAARTYTLTRIGQFESQGFDVWADERDQVYKGASQPDPIADRAIQATRGLVLESHGQLAQAYYSSTCGGHTSWIEHVWPKPAARYLEGRRDAGPDDRSWCAGSKHFRWTEVWSGTEIGRTLGETLPRLLPADVARPSGELLDLRVCERDASARVLDLEVRTTSGSVHLRGDPIRWALRPRDRTLLRSLMFELEVQRDQGVITRVVARGGGNGHGVGMCQMGAIAMARAGYDVSAILGHYYAGTDLRQAY